MKLVAASRFRPDLGAGRLVRAFITPHLDALGMRARADDVQLVISELVTNVVLHARTPFDVRLVSLPDGVRIEVTDDSSTLPTPGTLDATALTGRGLILLQSLATRWGADPLPGDGKTVWCELGREEEDGESPLDVDALLAMWDDQVAPSVSSTPVTIEVTVPELPVQPLLAAKAHMEDLLRELQMILLSHPDPAATPPPLVAYVELARRLDAAAGQFAEGRRQVRQQALAAAARGSEHVTLHLRLPHSVAPAARRYLEAIEDGERLSQHSAHLLAAQGAMDVHADVRHRYLTAVVGQLSSACPDGTSA